MGKTPRQASVAPIQPAPPQLLPGLPKMGFPMASNGYGNAIDNMQAAAYFANMMAASTLSSAYAYDQAMAQQQGLIPRTLPIMPFTSNPSAIQRSPQSHGKKGAKFAPASLSPAQQLQKKHLLGHVRDRLVTKMHHTHQVADHLQHGRKKGVELTAGNGAKNGSKKKSYMKLDVPRQQQQQGVQLQDPYAALFSPSMPGLGMLAFTPSPLMNSGSSMSSQSMFSPSQFFMTQPGFNNSPSGLQQSMSNSQMEQQLLPGLSALFSPGNGNGQSFVSFPMGGNQIMSPNPMFMSQMMNGMMPYTQLSPVQMNAMALSAASANMMMGSQSQTGTTEPAQNAVSPTSLFLHNFVMSPQSPGKP